MNILKKVIQEQKELCIKQNLKFEEFKKKEKLAIKLLNQKLKEKQYEMGNTST